MGEAMSNTDDLNTVMRLSLHRLEGVREFIKNEPVLGEFDSAIYGLKAAWDSYSMELAEKDRKIAFFRNMANTTVGAYHRKFPRMPTMEMYDAFFDATLDDVSSYEEFVKGYTAMLEVMKDE